MTEKFAQLIDNYAEKYSTFDRHELLRTIADEDHHETYQVGYEGKDIYDKPIDGWFIACECDLTEGVGWEIKKRNGKDQRYNLMKDDCEKKIAAGKVRTAEFVDDYKDKPNREIILDLLAKTVEGNIWIGETHNGARFWGGGYYLQTAADIAEVDYQDMRQAAHELVDEEKIFLEGAVVCYPRNPSQREVWKTRLDDKYDVKVVEYNTGSKTLAELEIYEGDAEIHTEATTLSYGAVFGPDVDDVARWQERAIEVVDNL